jgi:malate dehydrogenase
MRKVCVIGAGQVGATVALYVAEKRTADVVLVDADANRARGKALDLDQAFPIRKFDVKIWGQDEAEALAGAAVVVIAAAVSSDPTETNPDLLAANGKIVQAVCGRIRAHAPEAVVIVVTTPLDALTFVAREALGFPRERVVGMSGVLHAARLRTFLAEALGVLPADATAMVLGGQGKHMVPIPRYTTVSGIPITELLPYETVQDLMDRTRRADETIFSLLKVHSSHHAPAAGVAEMVDCVVRDRGRLLPCSVCLQGEYGLKDVALGVPVILSRQGVARIVEVDLLEAERSALGRAARRVSEQLQLWRSQ